MLRQDAKAQRLSNEQEQSYRKCCKELGFNPNKVNQIDKAPSYPEYYAKSKEFLDYITGKVD